MLNIVKRRRKSMLLLMSRFLNPREVAREHELPPGRYVIVPCTFNAETEGEYVLRIFSEKQNQMQYAGILLKY